MQFPIVQVNRTYLVLNFDTKILFFIRNEIFLKKYFIYLFMKDRERERQRERERERQRHRQREKQAPCRDPDLGLQGSHPGPKVVLNH